MTLDQNCACPKKRINRRK